MDYSPFSHHSHPNPNPTLSITLRILMWCENGPHKCDWSLTV